LPNGINHREAKIHLNERLADLSCVDRLIPQLSVVCSEFKGIDQSSLKMPEMDAKQE
jgi:hypothetical protein